ncbi:hypothetical protein ACIGDM_00920 [Rothia koreensis]|uniref:hypothetical protein n=1 Tax=Rothia koreensis TaxID=592378 RepID=UPI0037CA032B
MTDIKRTIGATTLSATGGSAIGGALATIILYFFPEQAQVTLLGPVTIVVSASCALVGGWLSPSKAATLAPYLDRVGDDVAGRVLEKVTTTNHPPVEKIAPAPSGGVYKAQHAADGPAAVEPGLETPGSDYPDLEALAKASTV